MTKAVLTIPVRLDRLARRHPTRVFCRFVEANSEIIITYGDLAAEARAFAALYQSRGLRPGDVVVIMLPHHRALYSAFLGAMWLGAVPTLMPILNPKQLPEVFWPAHREVFELTGVSLLVGLERDLADINQHISPSITSLTIPESWACLLSISGEMPPANESDCVAFIQHSSGTTGVKKGVALTHRLVFEQVAAYSRALSLGHSPRVATWLPLYHDMGLVAAFILPLLLGGEIVAMSPFDWVRQPTKLLDIIERHRCTHSWLPNFAFHHIAQRVVTGARWDLSSLQAFINCSEPCRAEAFDAFKQVLSASNLRPNALRTCYAMAETAFAVTQSRSEPKRVADEVREPLNGITPSAASGRPTNVLSSGTPIKGLEVEITDDTGRALPAGCIGEIRIRGRCLFSGYVARPDITEERIRDGWYYTRDLGYLYNSELYVTGRVDDLLIVRGQKFYAHEIEMIVSGLPNVTPGRAIALAVPNHETGSSDIVVLLEGTETAIPEILKPMAKAKIEQVLGLLVHKVEVMPRDWLVKTTSGKIARALNLKRYQMLGQPETIRHE